MKLDPKLRVLVFVVFALLIALFGCEERYRSDGQMFQAVYGLLTGFSAILLNELRKEFGQPEDPAASQITKTTVSEVHTVSPPPPPAAPPVDHA